MNDETYNGHPNRETWAFLLHCGNDEGLYNTVRDFTETRLLDEPDITDDDLGRAVVEYVKESVLPMADPAFARMVNDEVGSWWRVDRESVGSSAREDVEA